MSAPLGWLGIARLGLVQTALGAIVVLTTSTMNRVMVVELALPAMLPGALVAFHYAVQMLRPRWGHGSDTGGRRTPWIVGGMAILALGGIGAALATAEMATSVPAGIALAIAAFLMIGIGVGASGTSLLALLATSVDPSRRAAAATVVWVMMIAGFVVTAGTAGYFLDPFSPGRLVTVTAIVAAIAFVVTLGAVAGVEPRGGRGAAPESAARSTVPKPAFREALASVWAEPEARRFTIFVFMSMLAYSAQDLILEPFAGIVFGMTPGESTRLSGLQNGGVLIGMLLVGIAGSSLANRRLGSLRFWTVSGCVASAFALGAIALGGVFGPAWPLRACVAALGVSNGAFAVAAIGSMMALAGSGGPSREGIRIGLWGSAQALAFGLGGFIGTVAVDAMRPLLGSPGPAYAIVFFCEALLFIVAARLAWRVGGQARRQDSQPFSSAEALDLGGFAAASAGRTR